MSEARCRRSWRDRLVAATAFGALSWALAPVGAARGDDALPAALSALLAKGTSLLAEEVGLEKSAPATEAAVDVMLNNVGYAWEKDQQRFQDQLYLQLDQVRALSPTARDVVTQMIRFNNMAVGAMMDLTKCDPDEASWKLASAARILQHVRGDLDTHAVSDWGPTVAADPKAAGGCR